MRQTTLIAALIKTGLYLQTKCRVNWSYLVSVKSFIHQVKQCLFSNWANIFSAISSAASNFFLINIRGNTWVAVWNAERLNKSFFGTNPNLKNWRTNGACTNNLSPSQLLTSLMLLTNQNRVLQQLTNQSSVLRRCSYMLQWKASIDKAFRTLGFDIQTFWDYKFLHFVINVQQGLVWFSNQHPMVTQKRWLKMIFLEFFWNCLLSILLMREIKLGKIFRFRWCFVNCY